MDLLNELEQYLGSETINEELTFEPVEGEGVSFGVFDGDDVKSEITILDQDGSVVDGVDGEYVPSEVTVSVEGDEDVKAFTLSKLNAMGFVSGSYNGEVVNIEDFTMDSEEVDDEYVDADDLDDDSVISTVRDMDRDDEISISDLEIDDDEDEY